MKNNAISHDGILLDWCEIMICDRMSEAFPR
jgi:hypothetical protein